MRIPLRLPPGLQSDDTTLAASGRWADGNNARFWQSKPESIGGWESLLPDTLTGVCRAILPWTQTNGYLNIAFGTHTKLTLYQGGMLYDITPPSGFTEGAIDGTGGAGYGTGSYGSGEYSEPSSADYFPLTWSFATYGQQLMANPRGQGIFRWQNDTATPAATLTNAPAEVTHMLVAPQDQVFALGCSEESGGAFNPLCIRHSGVRASTVWNTASNTTAREYILPGGGRIVAGRVIGPYLLVWTTHALFLGTFVGSLTQPWRFDRVGLNCGLIGPNAAVVVGQRAFWLGPDLQFRTYALGGEPITLPCPIRKDMADNLAFSQADKIMASSNAAFDEIWFDYPDSRDGYENSRYVAASLSGQGWFRGQMARTARVDAGPTETPLAVTYDGAIYRHERGDSADGAALTAHVETADIYLSLDRCMMVRELWPDVKGQRGALTCQVTARDEPAGDADDETTETADPMAPGTLKADFRISGRLHRFKFSSNGTPSKWRLGDPVVDAVPTGLR